MGGVETEARGSVNARLLITCDTAFYTIIYMAKYLSDLCTETMYLLGAVSVQQIKRRIHLPIKNNSCRYKRHSNADIRNILYVWSIKVPIIWSPRGLHMI